MMYKYLEMQAIFRREIFISIPFVSLYLQILEHMSRKKNFIFSKDCNMDFFIKSQERLRHGNSENDKQIVTKPSI